MVTRYVRMPDGRLVAVPTPEPTPPPEAEPEEQPEPEDENSDLFEGVEGNRGEQYLDEEDMDDLFGVSKEDIMGYPEQPPKPKRRLIRRTNRPYYPPPGSIIRPGL